MKLDPKSKVPKEKWSLESLKSFGLEKPSKNPTLSSPSPKFSNLSSFEQEELLRSMMEKEFGPLPSNFSNLSSSEKEELFRNRMYEKALKAETEAYQAAKEKNKIFFPKQDKSGGKKDIKADSGDKVNPKTELSFFEWVLGILAILFFLWFFSQDVGGGGGFPMRR